MGRKRKWTPEPGTGQSWHPQAPASHGSPAAGEAPAGTVPFGNQRARSYPPRQGPPRRTEPLYEHYNTDGYPPRETPGTRFAQPAGAPGGPTGYGPPREETQRTYSEAAAGALPRIPKKITVTRVAALRSRELSGRAVAAFKRATRADGADQSGLTSLTYAVMLNYASDAAMAVALANTLFFAATSGQGRGRVALYLLITIAPFALIAPVIGPALDRIQRGRRLAMCASSLGQGLMAVVMAMHFDDWGLYPAALGMMVLSKSFTVLKSAITPRVLPRDITLSKTNARLTVFGLIAGGVFGALASGVNSLAGAPGALWFTALICVGAAWQSMRIPAWVEVTEGEVPTSLKMRTGQKKQRQPLGGTVVVALWGNGSIRVLTGFLMMFAAFAVKAHAEQTGESPFAQLLLLGLVGVSAGAGGFVGNALGSRLQFGHPNQVVLIAGAATLGSTVLAAVLAGIATAAIVALVGATASALAKVSLDAVIQQELPEESRASAFGRSETVLQLAWCFGGAVGLLLPPVYWVGFLTVSLLLAVGLTQTYLLRRGSSLVPWLKVTQPPRPAPATDS